MVAVVTHFEGNGGNNHVCCACNVSVGMLVVVEGLEGSV